ncbi:MAG: arylamine N-acetyltransferase [Deltaproteobacteria bacterium]|nr:arylamine N-acetyltransferase [Deltaproteobacteria bacterium]
MTLDLDRYFERIGWTEPVPPTFATVSGLLRAHMMSIPFENLDVLMGKSPSLELDALQAKLIDARRGGYCYEHATLFGAVLERLGFAIARHSARVTVDSAKHASPRTHMLLSVELPEGGFVLDPGFGSLAPMVPVPVDGSEAISRPDTRKQMTYWIDRDAGDWILKVRTPDGEVNAWVTPMTTDYPIDFVMANHFTSTHPRSLFTRNLMLRAFVDDDTVRVMNRDVTDAAGARRLADRAELQTLLSDRFGIDLDVSGLRVAAIPEWP